MSLFQLRRLIPLAFATLAAAMIYAAHAGDFYLLDSLQVIAENPWLEIRGHRLDDWRVAALGTESGPLGRPLSMLSFAVDQVLFGAQPALTRLHNIFLHLLTGVALAAFLYRILSASPLLAPMRGRATVVAMLAAALWVLHPLHVSTVFYAVQRMTILCALFSFLGLALFFRERVRWLQRRPAAVDFSRGVFWLALGTGAAALSKENGLLLPWLAAVTELTLFRCRVDGGHSRFLRRGLLVLGLLPVLGLCYLWLGGSTWLLDTFALFQYGPFERLLTQFPVLWQYLGWILAPWTLSPGLFHDDTPVVRGALEPQFLLALVAFIAVLVAAWRWRNRYPLLAFAAAWFAVGHALESSFLPLVMVFEHRNYLPSLGPLLLVAAVCLAPIRALSFSRQVPVALLCLVLAGLLFYRSSFWRDELQLAEHHYQAHPGSVNTLLQLARLYQSRAASLDSPEQAARFAAAAREVAYRAHRAQPARVAPLVLLVRFDSRSSEPLRAGQWYILMDLALQKPALTDEDILFLSFLGRCANLRDCVAPPGGMGGFLSNIAAAFPDQPAAAHLPVVYCLEAADRACAARELADVLDRFPDYMPALESRYSLYRANGDAAGVARSLRALLAVDHQRRLVNRLTRGTPTRGSPTRGAP